MLQYVDDTIFFREPNANNVFSIKTILRMFELASKLKVNFFKSCFGAIGVDGRVVERYANLLNCKTHILPFVHLGLHIGRNPRKVEL